MCKGASLASAVLTIAKGLLSLADGLLEWNIVRENKQTKQRSCRWIPGSALNELVNGCDLPQPTPPRGQRESGAAGRWLLRQQSGPARSCVEEQR